MCRLLGAPPASERSSTRFGRGQETSVADFGLLMMIRRPTLRAWTWRLPSSIIVYYFEFFTGLRVARIVDHRIYRSLSRPQCRSRVFECTQGNFISRAEHAGHCLYAAPYHFSMHRRRPHVARRRYRLQRHDGRFDLLFTDDDFYAAARARF